jgi:outer membrane immunogenic protein
MKRLFAFATVAAAVLAAPAAHAQASWSGIYLGPEAGGSSARLKVSGADTIFQLTNEHPAPAGTPINPLIVVPATSRDYAGSDRQLSLLYGGFAGAQLQTGSLVFGVEGDFHGSRDAGRFSASQGIPTTLLAPASTVTESRSLRTRYDWSARGRIGFATERSLFYATGGIAQTKVRLTGQDTYLTPAGAAAASSFPGQPTFQSPTIGPVVTTFTGSARMTGWTAGIGGEQRVGGHFGIGLDARYVNFGSKTISFACSFQSARTGQCGNYSTPPIVIYGRTHDSTDTTPGAEPGTTRTSLAEWRLAVRVSWHF